MQPLSLKKRRAYLWSLFIIFFVSFPIIVLYATGYRFTRDFLIVETGGIFVGVPGTGAVLYIDNEPVGTTTLLSRSFFTQNLKPGVYSVRVERDGFYPWQKVLTVEPYIVTDARAVSIPQTIQKVHLLPVASRPRAATTTPPDVEYLSVSANADLVAAFKPATTTAAFSFFGLATSSALAVSGNVGLFIEDGNLVARFDRATSSAPANFCTKPSRCVSEIFVEKGSETVSSADFLFGNRVLAIYTTESGVYLSEIDARSPRILVPLYQARGAEFRFLNNELIIKDGKNYYRLEGF